MSNRLEIKPGEWWVVRMGSSATGPAYVVEPMGSRILVAYRPWKTSEVHRIRFASRCTPDQIARIPDRAEIEAGYADRIARALAETGDTR